MTTKILEDLATIELIIDLCVMIKIETIVHVHRGTIENINHMIVATVVVIVTDRGDERKSFSTLYLSGIVSYMIRPRKGNFVMFFKLDHVLKRYSFYL